MKDIKIVNCSADVDEAINVEFFLEGSDVTAEVIDTIISRIDNFYDCNGLSDIFDDSYDNGEERVWKVEAFFNAEDVDETKIAEEVKDYVENLIKSEQV